MITEATAGVVRLVSGASVQWRCDPRANVQRIYFGNHASHLDFLMIWAALPARLRPAVRPVAGRDYWQHGAIRRHLASHVFNAVLVDRGGTSPCSTTAAARATTERLAREMGSRYSLIVFPEGTRSPDGHLCAFKSGIYFLSRLRPDVELVPVYLENLNRILPKGEWLPVPMLSRVVFGPPLAAQADESKEQFLVRARTAIIELGATS